MSIYDGDVRLTHTEDGGDIEYVAGQPVMDAGLETAVYISLFTSPGWWGDKSLGCDLEAILAGTLTTKTLNRATDECRRALAWLVSDGVASSVEPSVTALGIDSIGISIVITEPDGTSETSIRYRLNWDAERAHLEVS